MSPHPRIPPALWPDVSATFDEAMALPEAERGAWLAGLLDRRPDVGAIVQDLLHAHGSGRTVTPLSGALAARALHQAVLPLAEGTTVAQYRLLHPLGEGGMASVWAAEQWQSIRRHVALKLPFAGVDDPAGLADRFEHERDVLAGLEHPHIARLYDAGVSPEGQPYLAMELVTGDPITQHASTWPIDKKLRLFLQVLEAVRHAHGRLVIHRDLKPANILVTAEGEVKLLDFGIARLLGDEYGQGRGSGPGVLGSMFTPDGASPEQLAGGALGVASDIYSLGVVLYELVSGRRPYHLRRDAPESFAEQLAAVSVPPPEGPSGAPVPADLRAIVAKAMAIGPEDRYLSAEAFAADLERLLTLRPVSARPPALGYRGALFLRRHRWSVAALLAVVLALASGLGAALWQADQARAQARRAEAVKLFLVDVFRAADVRLPQQRPRGQTTARELLDAGARRVDEVFGNDPSVHIELLGLLAEIYGYLNEDERYSELALQHRELAERHHGPAHPVVIAAVLSDAFADIYSRNYEAADKTLTRLDGLLTQARLNDSALRAQWWMARSESLRATPDAHAGRLRALDQAAALLRRHGPQSSDLGAALANAGNVHMSLEAWARARDLFEQSLAVPLGPGESRENLPIIHAHLGWTLVELGDVAAAEAHFETATEQGLKSTGPGFLVHDRPVSTHARLLHRLGQAARARAMFEGLALASSPDAPLRDSLAREYEAAALLAEGRADEALPMLEEVLVSVQAAALRESDVRRVQGLLGQAHALRGRPGDAGAARALLDTSLQATRTHAAPDSAALATALERWGRFLLDQNELVEAADAFSAVPRTGPAAAQVAVALSEAGLARVALARGEAGAAERASIQALALWHGLPAGREVRVGIYLLQVRADVLQAAGRVTEAGDVAARAQQAAREYGAPSTGGPSDRDWGCEPAATLKRVRLWPIAHGLSATLLNTLDVPLGWRFIPRGRSRPMENDRRPAAGN